VLRDRVMAMSDAMYDAAIVALAKEAAGAGRLEAPDASAECDNPLCGDRITLDLKGRGGHVDAVGHKTRGCLLTKAAASLIGRHAPGAEAGALAVLEAAVREVLRTGASSNPDLALFAPVAAVRSRHDCVLLPFRALDQAMAALPKDL
jgi:nitrogen fixation NifU-like protein